MDLEICNLIEEHSGLAEWCSFIGKALIYFLDTRHDHCFFYILDKEYPYPYNFIIQIVKKIFYYVWKKMEDIVCPISYVRRNFYCL